MSVKIIDNIKFSLSILFLRIQDDSPEVTMAVGKIQYLILSVAYDHSKKLDEKNVCI